MPFEMFERIDSKEKLLDFFSEHFNDAIPLIGKDRLVSEYFRNPRGSLISIKVFKATFLELAYRADTQS